MNLLRKKLKNGMTVIMEKRELPVVSLAITNKFGAGYEERNIKGISHFIEHLVFTGTKTRTHEDISREIEKKGGILNAFTANQITSFWFKLPSEHIFSGLEIITDILKNPLFDREKFEKEKKVILEEIKMYHDDPAKNVHDKIAENLYESPFGESIAGDKESVSGLDRESVYRYYKERYKSGNYIAVIVGDADFDKLCEYLEKSFRSEKYALPELNVKMKSRESTEEREGIDQAHFVMGMHAPLMGSKEHYALEILDNYMANGMSSKLFLKIREEKGLAYTIQGSINAEKDYSYYTIYLGTIKEALPEIKKIIIKEFEEAGNMREKEFEESKERAIGLHKISKEESIRVMTELLFSEISIGAEEYYKYEENIRNVKIEDVRKLAVKLIKQYSTAAIVPK